MKKILVIYSIFFVTLCFSQSKKTPDVFEETYIITLKGDTLRGHLKMSKLSKNEIYQKISFRDKTNKIKIFLPEKIKGFGIGNYFYQSAYHNDKACFFKVLSSGKSILYQYGYDLIDEGEKHDVQDFCVMTESKKEKFVLLEEKGLKKQLKDIFKSNKELVQKINEQKEISYNVETLESLFKEFNTSSN